MFSSGASQVSSSKLYVDDVFSAYTYTGTGSSITVNNGIDLAGKGGLVWVKGRSAVTDHCLIDTARGTGSYLSTNTTTGNNAEFNFTFNSNGFADGSGAAQINSSGTTYSSWAFRKSAKFFDFGTFTGDGNVGRAISHALGANIGMVVIKATSATGTWQVIHRGSNGTTDIKYGSLENTNALSTSGSDYSAYFNSSTFTPGIWSMNASGVSYVWYAFAHDTSTDGLIQCGTFTSNISGLSVSLGWEPQYLLVKNADAVGLPWMIFDVQRGFLNGTSGGKSLQANASTAESSTDWLSPTATGFVLNASQVSTGVPFIYLAIRRPNKPPTTGTQVYNAIARTGTGAAATVTGVGFAPDLLISKSRSSASFINAFADRLRGLMVALTSTGTNAEYTNTSALTSFDQNGFSVGSDGTFGSFNVSGNTYVTHCFKRAPGFMDEVCYTAPGSNTTIAHNLGVAPELWIVKERDSLSAWSVGSTQVPSSSYLVLNTSDPQATSSGRWNSTYPTSLVFSLGTDGPVNSNGGTYVAYLFATLAGVSKVGKYTGNGTSQTINCGFTSGARFILIKRTDGNPGFCDWYVWDSVRGIVSANDPHLSLNTTTAEVTTDDSVDPDTSGFVVNQVSATNINISAGTYLYLAIA